MINDIKGKKVLLIGSSKDIDGRAMGAVIDGKSYDIVARVNKPYGTTADVGTRTDIIFVRRREWATYFWPRPRAEAEQQPRIVAFRDGVGCPRGYDDLTHAELALPAQKTSTGLCAAKWLLEQGAKSVTVIGFGYSAGAFQSEKTYAKTGEVDTNPKFNWAAENEWLRGHVTLLD